MCNPRELEIRHRLGTGYGRRTMNRLISGPAGTTHTRIGTTMVARLPPSPPQPSRTSTLPPGTQPDPPGAGPTHLPRPGPPRRLAPPGPPPPLRLGLRPPPPRLALPLPLPLALQPPLALGCGRQVAAAHHPQPMPVPAAPQVGPTQRHSQAPSNEAVPLSDCKLLWATKS